MSSGSINSGTSTTGTITGACGDSSALQGAAVELFQLAALLVGNESEAVGLVETTLASVEVDPCEDPVTAQKLTQESLLKGALTQMNREDPTSFAAVPLSGADAGCIEDDDLNATGISQGQLSTWLAGHGREDLRTWLRALPAAQRAIFVQRAVLGRGNSATAASLREATDAPISAGWTPEAVSNTFRQALCSLANALVHVPGVTLGEPLVAGAAHV